MYEQRLYNFSMFIKTGNILGKKGFLNTFPKRILQATCHHSHHD